MPCSRSARSPSVTRARLVSDKPNRCEERSTASRLSSNSDLVSYSRRPIIVDLPSSTEPAVENLTSSLIALPARARSRRGLGPSEIALLLAILHGRLGELVIGPRRPTLGDPGGGDLGDDVLEG